MSKTNDGGPAFPIDGEAFRSEYTGMSLRDYFAGQALGIIAAIPVHEQADAPYLAAEAYRIADAMLRAREEG